MARENALLTVAQAAKRLGVSPNTIRAWADRGAIPVVRLPSGHRRFEARAIDGVREHVPADESYEAARQAWIAAGERWARTHRTKLTPTEQERGLVAVAEKDLLAGEIAARHHAEPDQFGSDGEWRMRGEKKLTEEEVRRGLAALAEMKRMAEVFRAKYGPDTQESWQVLDEVRAIRERELAGEE